MARSDGGHGTGLAAPSFSEALAARVHELERELVNTRREVLRLRKSRELWKLRYKWAALAARQAGARRLRAVV